MIFVTVGTHTEGFDRLVEWIDDIADELNDEIIVQVGHTSTKPDKTEWFKFKDIDEIIELTEKADIVVGHGGAGTILTTLEAGTPMICVPRLEEHGEIYDDHQFELTNKLMEKGTLAVANSKAELRDQLSRPTGEITMELSADLVPHFRTRFAELEEGLA